MNGKIYLIPSEMGDQKAEQLFPAFNKQIIMEINYYIVENARTIRRFIKKICPEKNISEAILFEIDKHSPASEIEAMMQPLFDGHNIGIISEAGMPCIADPGNLVVARAHEKGIQVIPLVGPNSIIMALISSGFNGQNFAFHGYIPIKEERKKMILQMEATAARTGQTQIFMETPYRNQQLFTDLTTHLKPSTKLCIATDITLQTEEIKTRTISEWKKCPPNIQKRPSIFLIY
ncbi:MAG: SAM-dependent methyltransferase [Bacteroidales bacterium]|nr:SAM-dependent methyltransferase [Bacteroidales bacterium]